MFPIITEKNPMDEIHRLSIIIVSYNTCELLRQCLASVRKHSPASEVIVVDNASRDDSVAMVRREFPEVEIVALNDNKGFAAANNIGKEFASGDLLLLLNSDTYLEDDTLDRCATWMRAHPKVGAVSPRLIGFDNEPQLCAHPFPSFHSRLRQTFRYKAEVVEEQVEAGLGWLIGAALMVRRAALPLTQDLLDAGYFMYWEDTDLSSRLHEAGWSLAVYRDGHVRHRGGGSSNGPDGSQRPELYAYFLRGKFRWFTSHRPRWETSGIWILDLLDVGRKYLRGFVYCRNRERKQASQLARGLWRHFWKRSFQKLS